MATPVIMPRFNLTQETGTVIHWLRREGDRVERGDPLLEVETDKVSMEVESPASGILRGIRTAAGETVPVTTVMAYVLEPGEPLPDLREAAAGARQPGRQVTPLARRVADAAGIDVNLVPADGRVTRRDVESFAQARRRIDATAAVRATPAARRVARVRGVDLATVEGSGPRGRVQGADVLAASPSPPVAEPPAPVDIVPLSGIRRRAADKLQTSYQSVPHVAFTVEADMAAMEALRDAFNRRADAEHSPRITVTAVLVKVCAWALKRHPWVNASLVEGGIRLHAEVNIGVAVALDDGLIVPVVRGADRLGLSAIAARIRDVAERGRRNRLTPDDVSGGTFTISNLGMHGIDRFTAIINPPESAILAVGRLAKRPIAVERETGDEVVIRPMMAMTLSVDHRVLDGVLAARFLQDVIAALEQPGWLLW